jgi:hypothetical protein
MIFFFSSALFNSLNWSESQTLISQPLDNTSELNLTMFEYPPVVELQFPNAFNREMTPEITQEKMVGSMNVFSGMTDSVLIAEGMHRYLPLLLKEHVHAQQSNLVCRNRELDVLVCRDVLSHHANICTTALFMETWICPCCGRELCAPCVTSINEVSPENMFR